MMKINIFWGNLTDTSAEKEVLECMCGYGQQCFFSSGYIGWLTLTIIYFHYRKTSFLDQSIPKHLI